MTDVERLSNVDLLDVFQTDVIGTNNGGGIGPEGHAELRREILSRMDTGIKHRDDVAVNPDEHNR